MNIYKFSLPIMFTYWKCFSTLVTTYVDCQWIEHVFLNPNDGGMMITEMIPPMHWSDLGPGLPSSYGGLLVQLEKHAPSELLS